MRAVLRAAVLLACMAAAGNGKASAKEPQAFLFLGSGELPQSRVLAADDRISGVQAVYNWRQLEPSKDKYDFSAIEADLAITKSLNKALFVQVQDRFFALKARNVPDYLLKDPRYGGGLAPQLDNPGEGKPVTSGWVSRQWDPAVRERFQALLAALAAQFDGRIYGINLPETAADLVESRPAGFTCDGYFDAALENLTFARKAFQKSHVVQYVNFWPCEWNNDRRYMERLFALAESQRIGLGGPDIVPYRKGQMKNAYPFFNKHRGKLPLVAMAVQQPTLTYTNPATGKRFTKAEIQDFARDYLGVDIIFWTTEAPWLRDGAPASN